MILTEKYFIMGDMSTVKDGSGTEAKVTTKRHEYEDGSYEEISVEEVEGGFIKTVSKHYKDDKDEWQWDTNKSVHKENPLDESGLADKLAEYLGQGKPKMI